MAWFSLQMISLGLLLIFSDQPSSSAADAPRSSRCISEEQLNNRTDRFQRRKWETLEVSKNLVPEPGSQQCAEFAQGIQRGGVNNRSLSPWTYSIDRDLDRIPPEISVAKCLCHGCIINRREDNDYNSLPVYAPLKVQKKIRCSSDPNKYAVKNYYINVSVACICAVPKYHK